MNKRIKTVISQRWGLSGQLGIDVTGQHSAPHPLCCRRQQWQAYNEWNGLTSEPNRKCLRSYRGCIIVLVDLHNFTRRYYSLCLYKEKLGRRNVMLRDSFWNTDFSFNVQLVGRKTRRSSQCTILTKHFGFTILYTAYTCDLIRCTGCFLVYNVFTSRMFHTSTLSTTARRCPWRNIIYNEASHYTKKDKHSK